MSGSEGSKWIHRAAVTAMTVLAAVVIARVVPDLASVPADLERRLEATWLYLVYAVYAGVLAQFTVWKVGDRPEGRSLAVLMGFASLARGLSVTPAGEAGPWGRWAMVLCVGALFPASIRFWRTYPQEMNFAAVQELCARRESVAWFGWVNRTTALAVSKTLHSTVVQAVYVAASLVFAFELSAPGSYRYNMFLRVSPVSGEILLNAVGLPAVLLSVAFAWTAFRLADAVQRKRVLWILYAQLIGGLWVVLAVTLGGLDGLVDSAVISFLADLVVDWYAPVNTGVGLTGFAVGIFYSGAFDLRPLINKTTIYGAALLTMAFVFAGVEELVESVVATRLNVGDGLGSWIGAAAVGMAFGPMSKKLEGVVRRIGAALEPPGTTRDPGSEPPPT